MHGHEHHLAIRKSLEKVEHLRTLNSVAYALGIIGPMMALPQIYTIWVMKNALGVSLVTWSAFAILSMFWCYYASRHGELPLVISQGLWTIMNLLVVIGTLLYR